MTTARIPPTWPRTTGSPRSASTRGTRPDGAPARGSSELPGLLADRAVDTVVVTGTVTNVCAEDHNATIHVVHRSYGDVCSTEEVLGLIAAGAASPG